MKDYLLLLRGGIPMTSRTEVQNKEEMQAITHFKQALELAKSKAGKKVITDN